MHSAKLICAYIRSLFHTDLQEHPLLAEVQVLLYSCLPHAPHVPLHPPLFFHIDQMPPLGQHAVVAVLAVDVFVAVEDIKVGDTVEVEAVAIFVIAVNVVAVVVVDATVF